MKRLFILAISVSLFFVAHDQVEAQRLTAGMKKQLAQQMVKNAYNPDFFESCMKDAGGIDKIAHITAISLNTSSGKQYLVTGKADTATCAFGASKPMYWVYEYRNGKFRMIADIGACSGVKRISRRTNG